ncbi:CcdB family protein [Roseomonas sp. 18066]|uniref:CcdB family protein n=1 Tax=Roseomonas sp. 18066 TaxID=2681412 RepID=UPI00135B773C|nr:CcdB family protein [Roseomonas sp. 18066]
MPRQFDVCRNPGRNRTSIPYVVAVQSNEFEDHPRRVVVPLVMAAGFGTEESDIGPRFIVEGIAVVFDPLQIASIPASALGEPILSLRDDEDRIVRALDTMFSVAWR